ncbi:hypothetical protein PIB30_093198, partial [Stylosanthes scabra]|nr:hypothetical protein [Stylosanthes scabra]
FPRLGIDSSAWALNSDAWLGLLTPGHDSGRLGVQHWALGVEFGRLGAGYLALACLGADSGRLGVQLFCCNFPRVVLGSNQLSTIDIYIPNRSPGRKLSNAIGIK